MITATLIAVALLLGYVLAVGILLMATFGLTAVMEPGLVAQQHRITPRYKRMQAVIWLVCVTAGAFVTCMVAQDAHLWIVPFLLTAVFVGSLWLNTWEVRQRGMAHQILMNIVSVIGVASGYALAVGAFHISWR